MADEQCRRLSPWALLGGGFCFAPPLTVSCGPRGVIGAASFLVLDARRRGSYCTNSTHVIRRTCACLLSLEGRGMNRSRILLPPSCFKLIARRSSAKGS